MDNFSPMLGPTAFFQVPAWWPDRAFQHPEAAGAVDTQRGAASDAVGGKAARRRWFDEFVFLGVTKQAIASRASTLQAIATNGAIGRP